MKQWVNISGAGQKATRIIAAGSSSNTGTVIGASNAELSNIRVDNTGGNTYAIAISNDNVGLP